MFHSFVRIIAVYAAYCCHHYKCILGCGFLAGDLLEEQSNAIGRLVQVACPIRTRSVQRIQEENGHRYECNKVSTEPKMNLKMCVQ